jgi:poly(3-hydroxybutyrate) depolymerase
MQHSGFVAMNPDRHLKSHYDYFLDLVQGDQDGADEHRAFYDEYNAVLDMPAAYYLDTIRTVFQEFGLVNGTWRVRGKLVKPQDIKTTALLTVEGELDDISGAGQTRAAHDLCTNIPAARRFHYDVAGAGHYGIFSGRRWREKVYPEIRDFIRQFDASGHPHAPLSRQPAQRKSAAATRIGAKPGRPSLVEPAATSPVRPDRKAATVRADPRKRPAVKRERAPVAAAAKRSNGR